MLVVLFVCLWAFLTSAAVYGAHSRNDWGLNTFGNDVVIAFIWAMFLLGPFFVRMFRSRGIIVIRRIVRAIPRISIPISLALVALVLFTMAVEAELGLEGATEVPTGAEFVFLLVFLFLGSYIASLLLCLVGYVMFMGLVGLVYLVTVGFAPPFLRRVRAITSGERWYGRALAWLFFIPDSLDTSTLRGTMPVEEEGFPWHRFRRAVAWQSIFAMLVAVLVSLNPLLLESLSVDSLFNLVDNAHILVPLLFLPLLVFQRLGVVIDGPARDFSLYVGIRTRLVRTFLAVGTMVLFIRMALRDLDPEMLLIRLGGYALVSILLISVLTWLYFNFVEHHLASQVVQRAPWLVEGDEGRRDLQ